MSETMSSAVATTVSTESPGTNGIKRMQSEDMAQEQESKRQRTSPGKNSPTATEETAQPTTASDATQSTDQEKAQDTRESRRQNGIKDEKQRSKRLFGALLGNLNQPSDRVSRRRTEIEQRRKAELQKQDDERLEDRQNRLERLALQRKKEQITYDEHIMNTKHRTLLNAANFLQTRTEPKMYYRPWELLPDEEDRIEDQLKEAQAQVDAERAQWEQEKQRRLETVNQSTYSQTEQPSLNGDHQRTAPFKEDGEPAQDAIQDATDQQAPLDPANPDDVSKPAVAPDTDPNLNTSDSVTVDDAAADEQPAAQPYVQESARSGDVSAQHEDVEEEGDHMVEGDEDTVIY